MNAAVEELVLVMRQPQAVARRCVAQENLAPLVAASLGAIVLGAAVFGGVVGGYRGGIQVLFAGLKVPLAMLGALVLCVPAYHALGTALGRPLPLRSIVALTVTAAARASLVLLALCPGLWLFIDLGTSYHGAALLAALVYALAGLTSLSILLHALHQRGGGSLLGLFQTLTTMLAFALVFLLASAQTSWLLRPYLVRPRTEEVPLLRRVEGGVGDALFRSTRSAAGMYDPPKTGFSAVPPQITSYADAVAERERALSSVHKADDCIVVPSDISESRCCTPDTLVSEAEHAPEVIGGAAGGRR